MSGPLSIYLRMIDYNANTFNSDGTITTEIVKVKETLDINIKQFISIISFSDEVEQTLNIGSQSSGAGAGKITFNPLKINRSLDALTPGLFRDCAAGTPLKTVELFFVDDKSFVQVIQTYKLVAVKTISWSAATGDSMIAETITFEYGGLVITYYQQSAETKNSILQSGWNRIRNISDDNLNTIIL